MAYNRNQKHRNQSDTNARNHDSKKKHFKKRKRYTREDYQIPGCARGIKVPEGFIYASNTNSEWMTKSELQKWMDTNKNYLNKI